MVDPPTAEESIEILEGIRHKYEEHHRLIIDDDALEQAVILPRDTSPTGSCRIKPLT
ncbi:MAG: hypothetical protein R3C24_12120 [Cyanobacteriota/Melainabacteria group bacterium]